MTTRRTIGVLVCKRINATRKRIVTRLQHRRAAQRNVWATFLVLFVFCEQLAHSWQAYAKVPQLQEKQGQNTEVVKLSLDLPVERELAAGERHVYHVPLVARHFVSIDLAQRGIDIVVELLGPDNSVIAKYGDEISPVGIEQIQFVAETTAKYTLVLESKLKGVPPGSYEIRIIESRLASEKDRSLHEARKLRTQVMQFYPVLNKNAESLLERALAIVEKELGPYDISMAGFLKDLGDVYFFRNDAEKARPLFERALSICEKEFGPEHPRTGGVAQSLANLYLYEGELVKADQMVRRALNISEKTLGPEHPQVARCLLTLGILNSDRRDLVKAEQLYQRALSIVEKTEGTEGLSYGQLQNNLGLIYLHRRDYEQAEPFLQRALKVEAKLLGEEHPFVAIVLQNLGIIARDWKKDYAKAEAYYLRVLSIREKNLGPDHPDVAWVLNNLGNLYRAKGDYAKALETLLRTVSILEQNQEPVHYILPLANIARVYAAMGDLANAVKFQQRVDAAIEKNIVLNLAIGAERQKLAYLNTIAERTDRTISLNMQLAPGDSEAIALAALVLLQRKGRVLDAMTDTFAALRRQAAPRDQVLLDQLNETTSGLVRLILNGPQKMSVEDYRKTIKALEEKKEDLEADISLQSAEFRAQLEAVTLERVKSAVPGNAALIEFAAYRPFFPKAETTSESYGATRYAAYVIRDQHVPRGLDLGEAKAIDSTIDALRNALRDPLRHDVRELARAVDAKVMRPIRVLIGDANHLLISADGELNLIPFAALIDEEGRYLIQRYTFTYLSSGRDLLRMQTARETRNNPLVVANPAFGDLPEQLAKADPTKPTLPKNTLRAVTNARNLSEVYFAPLNGTTEEANAIQRLFPKAQLLMGTEATKSALKKADTPRILHVATHGFFVQDPVPRGQADSQKIDNPLLRSGLALAGANLRDSNGGEGILTAFEATALNVRGTRLVVLSACDTGIGEVRNGEGVFGLRRAFVLAGAESLLMSLWPVSDYSTRTLMTNYYQNLKKGMGRGAAMRQVQLDMLKRNRQLHPFYWANFIQSGEWANLDGQR